MALLFGATLLKSCPQRLWTAVKNQQPSTDKTVSQSSPQSYVPLFLVSAQAVAIAFCTFSLLIEVPSQPTIYSRLSIVSHLVALLSLRTLFGSVCAEQSFFVPPAIIWVVCLASGITLLSRTEGALESSSSSLQVWVGRLGVLVVLVVWAVFLRVFLDIGEFFGITWYQITPKAQ
jgi:hypothetical protein